MAPSAPASSALRSDAWSATQYLRFEDERTRPVRDLLAAIPPAIQVADAIDVGCGPGNSTELLAARYPAASIRGIDSSLDMIAAARARLPALQFEVADVERWMGSAEGAGTPARDARFDVILANAVLHWLPDHGRLFPALMAKLAPGGALAVQMPDNLEEPAHRLMRELAVDGPWAGRLAAALAARPRLGSAAWYHQLLRGPGRKLDIWRTTYFHVLPGGATAIVEWFKGSGLRPFLAPLGGTERADFIARYESLVSRAYPVMEDGHVVLPFPRLFILVTARADHP